MTLFYAGHTYEFVATARTWADAGAYARADGGYLAVITSAAENNAVAQAALADAALVSGAPVAPDGGGAKYLWLGGSDAQVEGRWAWTDGSSLAAYSNWASGALGAEPDDFGGAQDALAMALQAYPQPSGGIGVAGKWNDVGETNRLFYVVELDELRGTTASETITGSEARDYIRGMDGADTIDAAGGDDDANGNVGEDSVVGGAGADWVRGGRGDDTISGGIGDDPHVNGNIGADRVYGGDGNDSVYGGQDNDSLYGEAGADLLSGDLGRDQLTGGAGADVFVLNRGGGADVITDFSAAQGDRIRLPNGATVTVGSVGAETLIEIGGGDSFLLSGVSGYSADWLLFA